MSGDRLRPSIRPGLSRTQVSTVPTHPGFLAGRCPYLKDDGSQLPPSSQELPTGGHKKGNEATRRSPGSRVRQPAAQGERTRRSPEKDYETLPGPSIPPVQGAPGSGADFAPRYFARNCAILGSPTWLILNCTPQADATIGAGRP